MKKLFGRASASFTMAEILISLTIIGVIAAITLPALRANINEKTWATQKKALFSRMSQAVALLESINTYDSARAFITEGMNDVLKINNICDGDALHDCGINSDIIDMAGTPALFPQGWADLGITSLAGLGSVTASGSAVNETNMLGAFETQNGESIALYFNPNCIPDDDEVPSGTSPVDKFNYICANMIYDLNQDKGPNTVGKDIGFMTVFYASDPVVVQPIPGAKDQTDASVACSDKERIPTVNEAMSLVLNQKILGNLASSGNYATSGRAMNGATTYHFTVSSATGGKNIYVTPSTSDVNTNSYKARCIKR